MNHAVIEEAIGMKEIEVGGAPRGVQAGSQQVLPAYMHLLRNLNHQSQFLLQVIRLLQMFKTSEEPNARLGQRALNLGHLHRGPRRNKGLLGQTNEVWR